jgi:hypothetical protein
MYTIPEEMPIEQRRTFLHDCDKLVGMFGAEKIDELLMTFPLQKLLEVRHEEVNHRNPQQRPRSDEIYLGTEPNYVTSYRMIDGKEYSRTDRANCHHYLAPNRVQHCDMPTHILKPAMLWRWPWLSEFKLAVYSKLDEFYVEVGVGILQSLYVPFEAMTTGQFHLVRDRVDTYFRWYTKDKTTWGDFKDLPETVKFMEAFNANLGTR